MRIDCFSCEHVSFAFIPPQPVLDDGPSPKTSGKQKAHSAASSSGHKLSVDPSPGLPVPPANAGLTSSSSHRSIADASAIHIERTREAKSDREDDEENVISINLSSIASNPQSLPDSLKLQTDGEGNRIQCAFGCANDSFIVLCVGAAAVDRYFAHGGGEEEDSYSLIIHPSSSSSKLSNAGAVDSQPKPLWRKRETVRQERTVHYTTIDASGEQQVCVVLRLSDNCCHGRNCEVVFLTIGASREGDHPVGGAAHGVQGDRGVCTQRDHAVRADGNL